MADRAVGELLFQFIRNSQMKTAVFFYSENYLITSQIFQHHTRLERRYIQSDLFLRIPKKLFVLFTKLLIT